MRIVSAAFTEALRGSHQRAARVTVLDQSLQPVLTLTGADGVAIEGAVSTEADRRRRCTLRIADPDGSLVPSDPGDPLYPNALVRLERGIVVGGTPEYVSLGVFLIDRPTISVTGAGVSLQVAGQDRLKLALKSRFTAPQTYEAGIPVGDVIRSIAQEAGMGSSLYALDDGGLRLAATVTYDTGTERVTAMRLLAEAYALDLYVDADGRLALSPQATAATIGDPVFTFERGADSIMLELSKDLDDDGLYNHVLVSGEGSNLPPVRGEARDLNPASPAYNPPDGSGPIGDRLYTLTSALIRSSEQAQEVADAKLLEVALVEESITIPSIVHPALEAGDLVRVLEEQSRTADDYLVETIAVPLGAGAMSLTSRKLRRLS